MKKIFIGNCAYSLDEDALKEFIDAQGVSVTSVKIIYDKYSGQSRGFGFAELSDSQEVDKAIEDLNGKEIEGRALTVNEAREQAPRTGGGRDFGGRSSGGGGRGGGGDRGRGGRGGGRDRY